MKIKKCVLDGRDIGSAESLYDELARQLAFPTYFGRNMDALWDVLTMDLEGPIEIVWNDFPLSRAKMGDKFEKFISIFKNVEKERSDFKLILK